MASLPSTHCRSYSYSNCLFSSSLINGHHQNHRTNLFSAIPKRAFLAKASFQFQRNSHSIEALMQDGAVATPVTPVKNETSLENLKDGLLYSPISTEKSKEAAGIDVNENDSSVSITVVGASGDLAKKKIFPALFALYYEGCLPKHFTVFGYARSKMTDAELRNMVSKTLTCRIDKRDNCGEKMDEFLKRCFYHSGQYDSKDNFAELDKKLKEHEVVGVLAGHCKGSENSFWSGGLVNHSYYV